MSESRRTTPEVRREEGAGAPPPPPPSAPPSVHVWRPLASVSWVRRPLPPRSDSSASRVDPIGGGGSAVHAAEPRGTRGTPSVPRGDVASACCSSDDVARSAVGVVERPSAPPGGCGLRLRPGSLCSDRRKRDGGWPTPPDPGGDGGGDGDTSVGGTSEAAAEAAAEAGAEELEESPASPPSHEVLTTDAIDSSSGAGGWRGVEAAAEAHEAEARAEACTAPEAAAAALRRPQAREVRRTTSHVRRTWLQNSLGSFWSFWVESRSRQSALPPSRSTVLPRARAKRLPPPPSSPALPRGLRGLRPSRNSSAERYCSSSAAAHVSIGKVTPRHAIDICARETPSTVPGGVGARTCEQQIRPGARTCEQRLRPTQRQGRA